MRKINYGPLWSARKLSIKIYMINRKKIVFAINQLGIGGAENMLVEQANYINRELFIPYVITLLPNPKENVVSKLLPDVHYQALDSRGLLDLPVWWRLWRFFYREKIDVVITNLFDTNLIGRVTALLAGVRTILAYEHNIYTEKKRWQIVADRLLSRFTKKILVGSAGILDFTSNQEHLPREKFCLNYNSIPLKLGQVRQRRNDILAQYGLSANSLYIVTAGRLIEQKGHTYLIEAAKILRDEGKTNFQVLIFGQGYLREKLIEQITASNLTESVKLMGIKPIEEILALSDIFTLPSLWEGLSIALLQAMDAGCPIVATEVSGSKEALVNNESGLLVKRGQSLALSAALSRLIDDDRLRTLLGEKAHQRVKMFSITSNIKTIENLVSKE